MNLSVAIGMHQDAVFCSIYAAHRFINDVVVVPACQTCDRLGTDRAGTALLFPQVGQGTFSLQGSFHLYAKAFFQIDFPCRVIWITFSFDFLAPFKFQLTVFRKPLAIHKLSPKKLSATFGLF